MSIKFIMPYGRRSYRGRRYSRKRSAAASTISRAWKRRRARRQGLISRTVQANRRTCRRIAKSIETKVIDTTQGTVANLFGGQYSENVVVDNRGQEVGSNIPFGADLWSGMITGPDSNERNGSWIQMKSLTIKYGLSCISRGPARYTLLLVHDQMPELASSLGGVLQFTGVTAPNPINNYNDMAFQNLENTGKMGRYKILWRKTHLLSQPDVLKASTADAITTSLGGTPPNTFSNVTQLATTRYTWQGTQKQYPSYVVGSHTLKLPYKINYGVSGTADSPMNQTIRLMAFCTPQTGAATPLPQVRLQYYCRCRYKDA